MDKNTKIACLVLAGITTYAIYRYTKLSNEKKAGVWISLKETGKMIVGNLVPTTVKDKLAKNDSIDNHPNYGKTVVA